jgi:DNA gyrase subunit A
LIYKLLQERNVPEENQMEIGLVKEININQEMQQAYLDYAMSVIVSRALPDARDGMKPVHRRILYAMYDMGLRPTTSHKKSARVVGEVLGKYHPHSDQAVYDAMARLAQDFSMRYPLVDGQGNFGSVDGDPPAAMRYTEARLAHPALDIMQDIQKNTVDFLPNFDETMQEPSVLPAALPNMLINGATGIAVGMATNIPPHNLREVVDACMYMLEHWAKIDGISVEDLMQFVKGPDFPTAGVLINATEKDEGLSQAYATGRGRVTIQARAHIEDLSRLRKQIIVTELPFMTNKSALIEKIAKLVRSGVIEGISDLRDESDRQGMRIVIELSKSAKPEEILAALYRKTSMQNTLGIIMLALVEGEPRLLGLKQALHVYLKHRLEIVRRRSEFDLAKAERRSHILEGYRIALKNLDEIINLIRKSPDSETANLRLMKKYRLSEIQAKAILDMPLRRLSALERKKIDLEYKEIQKIIKELVGLLKSPKKMRTTVGNELIAIRENYGDRRKTQIVSTSSITQKSAVLTASDFTPDQAAWVISDKQGNISRTIGGKAPRLSGSTAPHIAIQTNTKNNLYFLTKSGKSSAIAVHAIPETTNISDGTPFQKLSDLRENEKLAGLFVLPEKNNTASGWFVVSVSKGGMIKKSAVEELPGPGAQPFSISTPKDADEIIWAGLSNGKQDILMATANGMAIRFSEDDVRSMGLGSTGVNGLKLKGDDTVVGATVIDNNFNLLFVASDGHAKQIEASQFPVQGRYGLGVGAWKLTDDTKVVGLAHAKGNLRVTVHLKQAAAKMFRIDEAPERTRTGKGKSLVDVKPGDAITGFSAPIQAPKEIAKVASKSKAQEPKPEPVVTQTKMDLGVASKSPKKKASTAKKKPATKKSPPKKKGGATKK